MGQIVDPVVLTKGLKTIFFKAYEAYKPDYEKYTTLVDSNAASENYGWLGTAPTMREWTDERVPKGLIEYEYSITNKHWENSIGVDRDDLADDQYGQINIRVQDLAERAKQHPGKLISEQRVLGTSQLCYDGQYFYDTDHSEGSSGSQSNILTGTGIDITAIETDLLEARIAFRKLKDDRGEPFHLEGLQFLVVAPPDLEGIFLKLLNAGEIAGTTNTLKGAADLQINSYLSDTNDWYLDITNRYIKSFILQNRQKIQFDNLTRGSENDFMRKHWYYGADARYNVGYGLWQMSIKITNA